jgi:hypothetical protein
LTQHSAVIAFGLIIVIVGVGATLFFGASLLTPATSTTTTGTSQTCSAGGCVLKLPIRFSFVNLYTNQPLTDLLTATIYKGTLQVDSTTISTGTWDTTKADFQSGEEYAMYVVSGNSKYEFNFQIPLAQTLTQPRYELTLKMALIGTYSVSVLAPGDVTITPSTGTYNVTASGNPKPTFTIVIVNSADNTGFTGTFQRTEIVQNGQPRKLVANAIVVTETGKARVVGQTGASYVQTLPDHAADRTRNPDGTFNQQGRYSTTLTFDTTGMTPNSAETITISYYAYLDTAYYQSNGVVNSEAYLAASIQFIITT